MSIYLGNKKVAEGLCYADTFNPPTDGNGKKFLSDDGTYRRFINDDASTSTDTSYSALKIEKRLSDVQNTIIASQESNVNIWQKTSLGVVAGTPVSYTTDNSSTINKIIVQCYKYVNGETGKTNIIKNFDNGDEDNFYHTDNVEFNGVARIKDKYVLESTMNDDGLYETEIIDKTEFLVLNGINLVD